MTQQEKLNGFPLHARYYRHKNKREDGSTILLRVFEGHFSVWVHGGWVGEYNADKIDSDCEKGHLTSIDHIEALFIASDQQAPRFVPWTVLTMPIEGVRVRRKNQPDEVLIVRPFNVEWVFTALSMYWSYQDLLDQCEQLDGKPCGKLA